MRLNIEKIKTQCDCSESEFAQEINISMDELN